LVGNRLLFWNWIQLATSLTPLAPQSPNVLQRVSTAVWGVFVRVTNLMVAQDWT